MLHVVIRGQVQGVGFRWFARERARELGVAGWVRNNRDGSVEVAATGPETALSSFRDELRSGPPGAMVSDVEDVTGTVDPPFTNSFQIVR